MYKLIKTRRTRVCDVCEQDMKIGTRAVLYSLQISSYKPCIPPATPEIIGVKTVTGYHHNHDCTAPEECQRGEHEYWKFKDAQGLPVWRCKGCGKAEEEHLQNAGIFTYI